MSFKYKKGVKIGALIVADLAAICISLVFAFLLTVENKQFEFVYLLWFLGNAALTVGLFTVLGAYSISFSSVGIIEGIKISVAMIVVLAANIVVIKIFGKTRIGVKTAFIFVAALFYLTVMIRFWKRLFLVIRYFFYGKKRHDKKVVVVGAGDAGNAIIREMLSSDKVKYLPVCIVDDAPEKKGEAICGVKVVGTTHEISEVCVKYAADEIFIAMPSVDKKTLSEIINRCKDANLPVKTLPGTYQFMNGQVSVSLMRKIEITDLLGREQVSVNLDEIMGYIENKVILVTGGGGSIGSELCRQIATHHPKQLIILDIYENNAYDIEQELKRRHPELHIVTLIASVRDSGKMNSVFEIYRPNIVFHAAAHKHVPLMETSPNEAVKNNVIGTLKVARAADKYGVETFVQISTDKAVNPTNIMGASKRICEMIIQATSKHSKTKFVAVRFGNVLGSNGSVIPLFRKQIAEGGPVTITHKDIIRYFMTIPEAVSLVLQAGAYAKGGQIFVLDMGEPVKIYDLACNLIRLSGLTPNVDIDIVCTGLRPGEKLYEERLMDEEGMQKTPNGLINIAKPIDFDEKVLWDTLEVLYEEAYNEADNMKMKELVKTLVPTYHIDTRK
ncbi:MAG: polysaccharide biosynthesis protein [Clostridia bacterium]|nr:polysaccharide biosynthesis protein [Clostridia bacterium]